MLPTFVQEPPSGDKWLHEIKHDGYRTQLVLSASDRRAYTRNGFDWSDCYRFILADASRLDCSWAIIDGEIPIQDEQGRSDFDNLKLAIERAPERLIFYAFDLLHLNGADLRKQVDHSGMMMPAAGGMGVPRCALHPHRRGLMSPLASKRSKPLPTCR
jgi:ATP-dependent DNA ligase